MAMQRMPKKAKCKPKKEKSRARNQRSLQQYRAYQDTLDQAVVAAYKRFQGRARIEDLKAEADFIHVKCRRFWRPDWGTFENFLRYKLKRGLSSMLIREAAQQHGLHTREGLRPILNRVELIDIPAMAGKTQLSDEAAQIVRLALQSSRQLGTRKIRMALLKYVSELGWSTRKIVSIYQEIWESLP